MRAGRSWFAAGMCLRAVSTRNGIALMGAGVPDSLQAICGLGGTCFMLPTKPQCARPPRISLQSSFPSPRFNSSHITEVNTLKPLLPCQGSNECSRGCHVTVAHAMQPEFPNAGWNCGSLPWLYPPCTSEHVSSKTGINCPTRQKTLRRRPLKLRPGQPRLQTVQSEDWLPRHPLASLLANFWGQSLRRRPQKPSAHFYADAAKQRLFPSSIYPFT